MAKLRKQVSFKENVRDLNIFNFLEEEIQDTLGVSTYIKMLIEEDELFIKYLEKKKLV